MKELSYTKCGDYLIPNLTVPDNHYNIGKYGMLRREFLKEYHQGTYMVMLLNGTLLKHLEEIDKTCYEMLDRLIPKIAESEGVNEELKATDQIEWVRCMGSIKSRVEEILYHDYVYEEAYENEEI